MATLDRIETLDDLEVPAQTARSFGVNPTANLSQSPVTGTWYPVPKPSFHDLQVSFQRLKSLSELESDWDSYGAEPISSSSIHLALQFLVVLRNVFAGISNEKSNGLSQKIEPYAIIPVPNGGVQLEWRGSTKDLELEVEPTGVFSYLLIDKHTSGKTFKEQSGVSLAQAIGLVCKILID